MTLPEQNSTNNLHCGLDTICGQQATCLLESAVISLREKRQELPVKDLNTLAKNILLEPKYNICPKYKPAPVRTFCDGKMRWSIALRRRG